MLSIPTPPRPINFNPGHASTTSMKSSLMRAAPKLFKENTRIDWNKPAQDIHNLVRGLCPYPSAWTVFSNQAGESKQVKVFATALTNESGKGDLSLESTKNQLFIHTPGQKLELLEFQFEGKRKMSAKDWLVGNQSSDWQVKY